MRELTKKQKNILDKYIDCPNIEKLPNEIYEQLQKINDTEILWQNVNRYLWDNYRKMIHKEDTLKIINTVEGTK